ncbi:MAG TPA: DsbA family protein [Ktedonobacteraceae bacterium]|nr:DsbA family protein [Ktedonobacteraceae bacterium]
MVASSLEKLQQHYDLDIHWRSYQLRPPGSPPIPPQRLEQIKAARPQLQRRAREQYGVEINQGPMNIDSRPALDAEKYAESQGKGKAFHEAVMRAYWQEACDISDLNVLQEIAQSVGLDTENFASKIKNPEYDAQVSADIDLANEYGLDGVPALVFAEKYLVMGAQPYSVLQQVVERVQAESV